MPNDKPILIIAGPTAVGKTDASIRLAQELGAEIVSADSMQIYRGMDIGTAKPTPEQRRLVNHHMIDIVAPSQPYSVGDYLRDARAAIDGILASGGTPIVVGGTGLYIRALTRGLFHGPPADIELRERLLLREAEGGAGALYSDLVKVDPEAAVGGHGDDRPVPVAGELDQAAKAVEFVVGVGHDGQRRLAGERHGFLQGVEHTRNSTSWEDVSQNLL